MANGSGRAGCLVAAALAASSWQQQLGSAGWARAAAVAAASRGDRTTWVVLLASARFAAATVPDAGSCTGWTCSTQGQYCPPNVAGSGGSGYCCQSGSWVAGLCSIAESCTGFSCSPYLNYYCPPNRQGSSGDGWCCSGSSWVTDLSTCITCPGGQRWNTGGNGYCEVCGAGTYSPGVPATTSCAACSAGTYSGGGASSCSACPAGT